MFDLFEDVGFPFSPDGSLFGPAGGNVDAVDGIGEHTGEGLAAMGDGVGFEETGARFVPLVGFDGDMFSDEGSGFGGGSASFFIVDSSGEEESVKSGRRDLEEGLRDLWRERSKGLGITGEPERQNDLEAFGAREVGSEPDYFEGFEEEVSVINGRPSSLSQFGFYKASKSSE